MSAFINELNERHAVVMVGGKCVVMNEFCDPVFNRPDISFSSVADFRNRYANKKVTVPSLNGDDPSSRPMAKVWLESPRRRQYEGIVFEPGIELEGYFNLWRGFAVKPKKGDWRMYRDHLFEIICAGDTGHMDYLMAWMANIVQNPGGKRPGTAVVLRGSQGTGKGCFASNFGAIFGNHFLHITNQKHLTGNFNSHFKDCLFCFVDEGFWAGDKGAEGVIKSLVTEDVTIVEPKGKDAFSIKNRVNLLLASNSAWVVPAGFDERRFFFLDVSDARVGDRDYFNELFTLMDNGGREAMLHDLLEWPIKLDLRSIPRTSGLFDQVAETMDDIESFWLDCLMAGSVEKDEDDWPESTEVEKVYARYIQHAQDRNLKNRKGMQQFGRRLNKICLGIRKNRPWSPVGRRPARYLFPDLDECRRQFEKAVGMEISWEDES